MKRFAILLAATALATPAFAADVITEEPPAPAPVEVAPAYNWTSLYIGGQAGVAFGGSSGAIGVDGLPTVAGASEFRDNNDAGFTGGAHIGYDYQFTSGLILGGVADINYIDHNRTIGGAVSGVTTATGGDVAGYNNDVDINYFGTVRGKVGYAMDRVAVYATGGLAYADIDNDVSYTSPFASGAGSIYSATSSSSDKDKVGYSVGAGVDYLATQNISFGVEYLYTDLGKAKTDTTFTTGAAFGGDPTSFTASTQTDLDFHTVMAKASYRFN